jgi:hypothetical protein
MHFSTGTRGDFRSINSTPVAVVALRITVPVSASLQRWQFCAQGMVNQSNGHTDPFQSEPRIP